MMEMLQIKNMLTQKMQSKIKPLMIKRVNHMLMVK